MTSSAQPSSHQKSVPLSLMGKSMYGLMTLFFLGVFAWLLLLFLTSVGIFFFGWHSIWRLLQINVLAMTSHLWIVTFDGKGVQEFSKHQNILSWFSWALPVHTQAMSTLLKDTLRAWTTVLLVTQFIIERAHLFIVGAPSMLIFGFMGLVDGLVKRDIRKFTNARESTLFFHRSKSFFSGIFFTGYFLFMVLPVPIQPTFWILMLSLLIGFGMCVVIQHFKKYL